MGPAIPVEPLDVASDPSLAYLSARLALLDLRVRAAVERRRARDADPDDRFRGLYVSEAQVEELLLGPADGLVPPDVAMDETPRRDAVEAEADAAEAVGGRIRLRTLARAFGLAPVDVELLLVAVAPDLDPRFERLYGYLHDDISRRRASVGLAVELATAAPRPGVHPARRRLSPAAPLVSRGLVLVEDPDRPTLTRSLRVPDRITAHLLGHDDPDPILDGLLAEVVDVPGPAAEMLARGLAAGVRLFYIRERSGASGRSLAHTAFEVSGRRSLALDLTRIGSGDDIATIAAAAAREAALREAGLIAGPVEALAERGHAAVRAFTEAPATVALVGARAYDPAWSRDVALPIEAPSLADDQRHELWIRSIGDRAPVSVDPADVTQAFRLGPEHIVRAAQAAVNASIATGRSITPADIASGARAQNAAGLARLARRIAPGVTWEDLVLPQVVTTQLQEIAARARLRDRVVGTWGIGQRSGRSLGVTALFAGDSGTGKTMSAEVLAGALGFDLYVIDLSTVIDKYIGETEKNLDRIFSEADRVNGVLLFDEADALFGKRSEVKDARDRYANVEVAYLLQRMEAFDGIAILTTNLRANLDEAFTRRIDAIVDFPLPEEEHRLALWQRNLPDRVPQHADIDLPFLARRFKLAGGDIRNICVAAAFLAAAKDRAVSMGDLIRATEREYRKLGRLMTESEFGIYLPMLGG